MRGVRDLKSDLLLPCVFLASTGGAFWAVVRMSGEGCGWTSGLMWGLAWHYLSAVQGHPGRRPFGSAWFVLAMVVGMYFGGMHGYGQFHSWVDGIFHLESKTDRAVPINPLLGYWWNFLCGLGWGGVAAVFAAWSGATRPHRWWEWIVRIGLPVGLAWGFRAFTEWRPDLVMPLYGHVDYLDPTLCPDCARTTRTIVESTMWLGFCLGGFIFEALRRNWRNLAFMGTMGVGFAVAFTLFEWLHTLPNLTSSQIGWWKYWETSVGTVGGLVLGMCFLVFNRPLSTSAMAAEGIPAEARSPRAEYLLGMWLPLLVSFYHVTKNELPRLIQFVGGDSEQLGPLALDATLWILIAIGAAGAYMGWRDPAQGQRPRNVAAMFVVPYVLMFLMNYIPQFGKAKVWQNWALLVQLTIYAILFVIGLATFFRIARRAGRLARRA